MSPAGIVLAQASSEDRLFGLISGDLAVVAGLALALLLLLALGFRLLASRRRAGRKKAPRNAAVPEVPEARPGRGRRRRRKRRRAHRPSNPTLSETGGLPPQRGADPPRR